MRSNLMISMLFAPALIGCGTMAAEAADATGRTQPPEATSTPLVAPLIAADGTPAGQVTMRHGPLGLLFIVEGENWPEGWHGVHLHAVGSCEVPAFSSAGGHVNHPASTRPHGLLNWDGGPDYGDLQNVYAHADGTARAEVYLSGAGLTPSVGDMADTDGLALVIHANPDDHLSQPIGGAGARIACAVLFPG